MVEVEGYDMRKKLVIFFIVVLLLGAVFHVYRFLNPPKPKAGLWRNDELHMTIELGQNGGSAVITENGNTVYCDVCGVFNTSKYGIFETKEEAEDLANGSVRSGRLLFTFTCKKATDSKLIMLDHESGKKYVFYRIAEK